MKKVYWRPPNVSRLALTLVAVVALVAHAAVELLPVRRKQNLYRQKIMAARLAADSMKAIKAAKVDRGIELDPQTDPAATGMIGRSVTKVTSNTGYLSAKLTSTNPNFAAAIVDMVQRAGLKNGDVVAVGLSGSFPALNVATFAALQVMQLEPIVVTSTASSQWGANDEAYLWLDMEKTLADARLTSFRSVAATYGGIDDVGIGITKQGRGLLKAAMDRNGVRFLEPTTLKDAIGKRAELYEEFAGDREIRAYINVGGGSASVGTHLGKKQFRPGLNRSVRGGGRNPDSVMLRFVQRDVPVIHLSRIKLLAQRFDMPYAQRRAVGIGQGAMFVKTEYNRRYAGVGLIAILAALFAFIRWDIGTRLLMTARVREGKSPPEPMV